MKIQSLQSSSSKIAEVISDDIIISKIDDALNLMADLYYQNYDAIIVHEASITQLFGICNSEVR